MVALDREESNVISIWRISATILIILCHYIQWFEKISFISQIFNVGVPIFFIISGYLFGAKKIENYKKWLLGRLFTIVMPLYVYYVLAFVLLLVTQKGVGSIQFVDVLKTLLCLEGITGGGIGNIMTSHLWFVSYILICYLITPFLNKIKNKSCKVLSLFLALCIIIQVILIVIIQPIGFIVWSPGVLLYAVSFVFSSKWNRKIDSGRIFISVSTITILCLCLRLSFKYLADVSQGSMISIIYDRIIVTYTHLILGIVICFLLYVFFYKYNNLAEWMCTKFRFLNKNSYHVYIVHYMFTVGCFSMNDISSSIILNTTCFVLSTAIMTMLVSYISCFLIKRIKRH